MCTIFCVEKCEEPVITKFLGRLVHELGGPHPRLRCKATGLPKPTISWSPIRDKTRFIDNGKGVLTIENPVDQDAGIYSCVASNPCGRAVIETKLVVVGESVNGRLPEPLLYVPVF